MIDQKALNMALADLAEFGFVLVDDAEKALKIVKAAKQLGIHTTFRKIDGKIVIRDVQHHPGPRIQGKPHASRAHKDANNPGRRPLRPRS